MYYALLLVGGYEARLGRAARVWAVMDSMERERCLRWKWGWWKGRASTGKKVVDSCGYILERVH